MKKEFLVENYKDLNKYLQKNSLTCKLYRYKNKNSYIYEYDGYSFVLEEYKNFQKLILISNKDIVLDEEVKQLQEITDDERYSKEYIELFGDPKSYEFDEKLVFEKCDISGLSRLDLHFKMGMSSDKVFRVILYRLNQIFTLEYEQYFKEDIEYEDLQSSHEKLLKALKLSKNVFNKRVIKNIKNDFEDLYMLLNHQDTFERYVLNFQIFIHETDFYNNSDANKPIHFFDKKDKLFKLI